MATRTDVFLVVVDLVGSSLLSEQDDNHGASYLESVSQLYEAIEDWFKYCIGRTVPEGDNRLLAHNWAGDGGFALIADAPELRDYGVIQQALAKRVFLQLVDFITLAPCVLRRVAQPISFGSPRPMFRALVAVAQASARPWRRLANIASRGLNEYLKHEREFTVPDSITCTVEFMDAMMPSLLQIKGGTRACGDRNADLLLLPHDSEEAEELLGAFEFRRTEVKGRNVWRCKPRVPYASDLFNARREKVLLETTRGLATSITGLCGNASAGSRLSSIRAGSLEKTLNGPHIARTAALLLKQLSSTMPQSARNDAEARVTYFRRSPAQGENGDRYKQFFRGVHDALNSANPRLTKDNAAVLEQTVGSDLKSSWLLASNLGLPVLVASRVGSSSVESRVAFDSMISKCDKHIRSHITFPIILQSIAERVRGVQARSQSESEASDRVDCFGLLCVDFTYEPLPYEYTVLKCTDAQEQATHTREIARNAWFDPLVQQIMVFAEEIRYAELEEAYESVSVGMFRPETGHQ
ncbi:MAG: hypothetical protein HY719_08565 [Planctomycetes bacterium]|nr:hypothetical protein [Planctomycetota bacterium]